MRRGLIAWSKTELPEAVFGMRVAQTQAALANDGLDAFVTYINITRPAAATWLTGFVPYWSEGVLVLPQSGRPVLAIALSKRVQGWMERTASVGSVISTPKFGLEAAKLIAGANPAARIGVLELDGLPTGTANDLRSCGGTLVDATDLFERLRAVADPAEIALSARAAEIGRDALAVLDERASAAADAIAAVERHARAAGAEDVFIAVAPDLARSDAFVRSPEAGATLGPTFAVRLSLAYKGHWVRLVRTLSRAPGGPQAVADAEERFAGAVARLPSLDAFAAFERWLVEGTTRSQPLQALASSTNPQGSNVEGKVVTVTATAVADGVRVAVGGPAVVGSASRPSALLAPGNTEQRR